MGQVTHCKSCGAPAKGEFCEYCGTPLFTIADGLDQMKGRRCHIWFEGENDTIHAMDIFVHSVDVQDDVSTFYADNAPILDIVSATNLTIEAELMECDKEEWKDIVLWNQQRRIADGYA